MSFSKVRVAVLRGGPSHEYDVSLKTGEHVLSLLRSMPDAYEPLDIFISKDGQWHLNGIVHTPSGALRHVDAVFNALHGSYGEDGQVQQVLENLKVPYTGSGAVASVLAMNKDMTKKVYLDHGLLTPRHEVLVETATPDQLVTIFRTFVHPVVVKPADNGSSIGMKIAHTFHELEEAVKHAFQHSRKVLVEEFIRGKEATCGVVENARGERFYALLPVEIKKSGHIFDYESKYSGETLGLCPGTFHKSHAREVEEMAKRAHEALGLSHYSRSDFIISPSGKVYILETNSLPGFTEHCPLPKSLLAVGWQPKDFIDHLLKLALDKA